MDRILQFASQLALNTGRLLVQHYQSRDFQSNFKLDHSLVTEADLAADQFIHQSIQQEFPQDLILSEELNPTYPESKTDQQSADSNIWVIDPLDGTTNFSLGIPIWGVLISRLANNLPELSVMYYPILNELFTAQRGGGAYLNQQRLEIPASQSNKLSFFACCSRTFRKYRVSIPYKIRIFGSSAYTYCMVARGQALIGFEASPKIWDIASPWLLVREAGGIIETLEGPSPFPITPSVRYSQMKFPTLAAASAELALMARENIISRSKEIRHN